MENKILNAIENLDKKIENLDKKFEKKFDVLEKRFDGLENRFGTLEKRFDVLENKFGTLEKRFDGLENRFDVLENRFGTLESQTKENTQILKALMHSAEVNKAEHEQMMLKLSRIEGDVTAIKKDLLTVETVTANNYADIIKLKAVK